MHWNKVEPKPSVCHSVDISKLATTTLSIARKSPSGCEALHLHFFCFSASQWSSWYYNTQNDTSVIVRWRHCKLWRTRVDIASFKSCHTSFVCTYRFIYVYIHSVCKYIIVHVHVLYTGHIHMSTRQALVTLYATIGNVPTELPKKKHPDLGRESNRCWSNSIRVGYTALLYKGGETAYLGSWNWMELGSDDRWSAWMKHYEMISSNTVKNEAFESTDLVTSSVSHVFSEIMSGLWPNKCKSATLLHVNFLHHGHWALVP